MPNIFSVTYENYLKSWQKQPALNAATHGGGAIALANYQQKQESLKVQKASCTSLINADLRKNYITKKQAISQLNSLGVDGYEYVHNDNYKPLYKPNILEKIFSKSSPLDTIYDSRELCSSQTDTSKFASLSASWLTQKNENIQSEFFISTSEVSGKFNGINRTLNPIACIAVDPKPPISPAFRESNFANSSLVWGILGFFGVAVIQMFYLFLQEIKIIQKPISSSEQLEIIIESQNKILAILEKHEKRVEQLEKTLS